MKGKIMGLLIAFLTPLFCFGTYYSQCSQDKIIHEKYFWNCKSGVFIDIGAHDGISFSNSYFFEKELGWTGICIEPIPEVFAMLTANRKCCCIQGCISNSSGIEKFYRVSSPIPHVEMLSGLVKDYNPTHFHRMNYELSLSGGSLNSIDVKCYLLNDVLKQNDITHVNLLSIDTEGGEFEILTSIDFSRYQIDVITVEDNYNDSRFIPFLKEKGFKFVQRIEQDLLFVHNNFTSQAKSSKPRVSIISSVYNGDDFIEGFLKDITQQTIFNQCELIMINANSLGHEEKIIKEYMNKFPNIIYLKLPQDPGMYAVWNRAIKMASADFISNANLDDRSHPKALEIQIEEMEAHPDIDLVYAGYLSTTLVPNGTYFDNDNCTEARVDPPEFSIENMRYCLPGPRPVWRKSLHDRYGFFDESFFSAGDQEMWLRAVNLGSKFKKVPGFYTLYYLNPKGLSTDQDEKKNQQRTLELSRIGKLYDHLFKPIPPNVAAFEALYKLGVQQRNSNETAALESFFKAYECHPIRAEPLFQCAKIYRERGNVLLGYLLAKHALSHPNPKEELCFDPLICDHALLIEFANCALLLGKFKEGFDACSKLLANPNLPSEYKSKVEANYELAKGKLEAAQLIAN